MEKYLNIDVSFEEYPREISKGKTREERKSIFMRCYVVNVTEKELKDWSLDKLINYIFETDDCWNEDLSVIKNCYLLCNDYNKDDFYNEFSKWKKESVYE